MKWDRLGTVIAVTALALVLLLAVSPVIGFRLDPVRSGSMSPSIETGDLVISSAVDLEDIKAGDIIVFRHDGKLICHRVVTIDPVTERIQTKGDANEGADPHTISYDDVVSEVGLVVPAAGHVILFLQSVYGWILIITIVAVMFLLGWYDDRTKKDATSGGKE